MSAATLSDDTPLDPDDEILVAYLDGELDRKEQTELENRLLGDDTLRKRLQQLQTGWDLLDDLPDPSPSLKLVESTLELVVADIVKARPKSKSIWSRYRFPICVATICLLGVLFSFAVVAAMNSRNYRQQLQDLAIVENLDAYSYGSDLALMRQLAANSDWLNMVTASREIGDIQIESIADLSATPVEQREEQIKQLPLENVDQLNNGWGRFNRLDEATRNRIRKTAAAVSEQADADYLLQTMQAYAVWRGTLPPELREQIELADGKERRDAIQQAIERTQLSISKRSSIKLDDDSIEWIYFALRQIVQDRVDNGDQATIDDLQRNKSRMSEQDAEFRTIASIIMAGAMRGSSGRRRQFGPPGGGGGERPARLQPDELATIEFALPDRALEILDLVASGDPLQESTTLSVWTEETIRRKSPFRRDDSTPLQRYNELDDSFRDVLDLMPPRDIQKELNRDVGRFPMFGPPR